MRRTVNLGDYNSASIEVSIEEDVPENELKSDVLTRISEQAAMFLKDRFGKEGIIL